MKHRNSAKSLAAGHEFLELARHPQSLERFVGNNGQALARAVIDHGQHSEAPTIGHLVGDEVERPALIGIGISIDAPVPIARLRPPRRRTTSFSSR